MFRLKLKGIHSFVSVKKTNYCHLMQCWHWNTQDGICWFRVMEGLMQVPPPSKSHHFSHHLAVIYPLSGLHGVFVQIQMNFKILTWILIEKVRFVREAPALTQFSSLTSASWLWHFFRGRSVYFCISGEIFVPFFSIIACFGQLS